MDFSHGFPNPLAWVVVKCLVEVWVKKIDHPGILSPILGPKYLGQNIMRELSRSLISYPFCSVFFAFLELLVQPGPNCFQLFSIFGTKIILAQFGYLFLDLVVQFLRTQMIPPYIFAFKVLPGHKSGNRKFIFAKKEQKSNYFEAKVVLFLNSHSECPIWKYEKERVVPVGKSNMFP